MSDAAPVRLLIADDQVLLREGIASLLGIQPGIAREQAIRDARALRALVEFHGSGVNDATRNG